MKEQSFVELLEEGPPASKLTEVILHELSAFNRGKTVDFNFLSRLSVGGYCRSLGFATSRNWSMLVLDKIAPKSPLGPNVVPEREAKAVLAQLRHAIDKGLLERKWASHGRTSSPISFRGKTIQARQDAWALVGVSIRAGR